MFCLESSVIGRFQPDVLRIKLKCFVLKITVNTVWLDVLAQVYVRCG